MRYFWEIFKDCVSRLFFQKLSANIGDTILLSRAIDIEKEKALTLPFPITLFFLFFCHGKKKVERTHRLTCNRFLSPSTIIYDYFVVKLRLMSLYDVKIGFYEINNV